MPEPSSGFSFAALSSSISGLLKVGEKLVKVRDEANTVDLRLEYSTHVVKVLDVLRSAQEAGIEANNKTIELYREVNELKERLADKDRYTIKQVAMGVFCYVVKESSEQYKDARKLCCNCYDAGVKSTLNQSRYTEYNAQSGKFEDSRYEAYNLSCDNCKFSKGQVEYFERE